jgi:FkbM family methyltransferase
VLVVAEIVGEESDVLAFLKAVTKLYVFCFGRPGGDYLNRIVLGTALRAMGFNNYRNFSESGEKKFVDCLAKTKPLLCLDIGANVGRYSQLLLRNTASTVFAFEPLASACLALEEIRAEFPDRLRIYNIGVGGQDSEMPIFFGNERDELATFSPEIGQAISLSNGLEMSRSFVPVRRLDNFLKEFKKVSQRIDLIKIDVEGYEFEVLNGAMETIHKLQPKFIQIEYNFHQLIRGKSLFAIGQLLPGYRVFQMLPHGRRLIERKISDPITNVFIFSNFVFVRPDIDIRIFA